MDDINEAVQLSVAWIKREQDKATGGWSDRAGLPPNSLNTAEALIGLVDAGPQFVSPSDEVIARGVKFLMAEQEKTGEDCGCWCRPFGAVETAHDVPDIVRTAVAVQALFKTGHGDAEETVKAVEWLLGRRVDEGWGFRPDLPNDLAPTCFTLLALIEAHRSNPPEPLSGHIEAGLEFLRSKFFNPEDRSFGRNPPLVAAHTILVTLVLQEARRAGLVNDYSLERGTLKWLLRTPKKARDVVEEDFTITPAEAGDPPGYSFVYATDSLLIKALFGSDDPAVGESELAGDALMSLETKLSPDGGVFGYRKTPWATARAMQALSTVLIGSSRKYFPEREPEELGSPKAGPYLFAFGALILVAMVWLALEQRLSFLAATLLVLLQLAILLAYGKIGETSFTRMFKLLIDKLPGKDSSS